MPKFVKRNGLKLKISLDQKTKTSIFDKITGCPDLVNGDSKDLAEFSPAQWNEKGNL